MENHFAWRLARRANDNQGADLFTDVEFIIHLCAFLARVWRIRGMNRGARAGARPDFIRRARVVAVGQKNSADTEPGQLFEILLLWLHRINAEIAARVENEVAVEVVAVRFRKPRPGEDAV